jgi:hypothetical protein
VTAVSQKPSVGCIVLVPMHPTRNNGATVAPAIVTRVWSDECINVRVLADGDETEWRKSALRRETLDDLPNDQTNHWMWPPRT